MSTAAEDSTAKIRDAASGKLLLTLVGHTGAVNSAGFSPDGLKVITASSDSSVRIWDATAGKRLQFMAGHKAVVKLHHSKKVALAICFRTTASCAD